MCFFIIIYTFLLDKKNGKEKNTSGCVDEI